MKKTTGSSHIFSKLRWACRRGMLELDVVLLRILEANYARWSLVEREQFTHLLTYSDPELYAWLVLRKTPQDAVIEKSVLRLFPSPPLCGGEG